MDSVTTRLMGGLSNQMFQYATGHALAKCLDVPLLLDRTFLDSRSDGMDWTPRDFALDVFKLPILFASHAQVVGMRRELDGRWYRALARALPSLFHANCFLERGTGYDPELFNTKPPVYIEGFWQSEGYFARVANELRNDLFVPK